MHSSKNSPRHARKVSIESLDPRRLLSVAMSGGQLYVLGTQNADHVLIRVSPSDPTKLNVNLNGESQNFDLAGMTGVFVDVGGGRDNVIVDQTIALAGRDFQCDINIATRIVRSVDPFGDAQVRIEKHQKVGMCKFSSGFAVLKADRFQQREDDELPKPVHPGRESKVPFRGYKGRMLRLR